MVETAVLDRTVVVGSGSAGYRHASALRRRDPLLEIVVVRRPSSTQPLARLQALGVTLVGSVEEAAALRPQAAVVAGPATTHRHDAETLARAGAHLLIEKPLAATADEARRLAAAVGAAAGRLLVGYHLRFSSTVPAFRTLVQSGAVGTPDSFSFRVGQHLSLWRPDVDPRASVTARQDLGGGVLRELSHELDGLRYVLGDVRSCSAALARDGAPTDGLVDTVADLEIELESDVRGHVHLDMISDVPFRTWTVSGSKGSLTADLLTGTVTRVDEVSTEVLHKSPDGERDLAEANLIDHFIEIVRSGTDPRCSGSDGIAVLDIIEAAQLSDRTGQRRTVRAGVS